MAEDGEPPFAENPSEIPVGSVGWRKPIPAGFLSFLITGLGQAYNRQWRRTLGFVVMALFLDLLFLHFRVWATLQGLAVGLLVLLGWRIIMSVDAAVQARKRLQRPAQSVPIAATIGAIGNCRRRSVAAIYKSAQSASRLPRFPHIFRLDVPDTL